GAAHPVTVEVTAAHPRAAGVMRLEAPSGWAGAPASRAVRLAGVGAPSGWAGPPASRPFRLGGLGGRARVAFTVTPPAGGATASLGASVEVDGARFHHQRIEGRYDHIPFHLLHPPAI